jgi:hypothetical protein
MYLNIHAKWPTFLPSFDKIWISSTDFQRNAKYQISQESGQKSNADKCRWPNIIKLIRTFHNCLTTSKNDIPAVLSQQHLISLLKDNINLPPKEIIYFSYASEVHITVLEGH